MQIDHLVYAVKDLHEGMRRIADLTGVEPVIGGRHQGWGTWNALLSLGRNTYLEIIAPDPGQPDPKLPRVLGVDAITHPRLTRWAACSNDLERLENSAKGEGFTLGEIIEGQRQKPDGTLLQWRNTDPRTDPGDGIVPFFIDWKNSVHPAVSSPAGCELLEFWAEHPEPASVQAKLNALGMRLVVTRAAQPALIAKISTPAGMIVLK